MEVLDFAETIHAEVLESLAGMTVETGEPARMVKVTLFGEEDAVHAIDAESVPAIVVQMVDDVVSAEGSNHDDDEFDHHRAKVLVRAVCESQYVRGQMVRKAKTAIRANTNLATSRVAPRFVSTRYGRTGAQTVYLAADMTFEIQFHTSGASPETPL